MSEACSEGSRSWCVIPTEYRVVQQSPWRVQNVSGELGFIPVRTGARCPVPFGGRSPSSLDRGGSIGAQLQGTDSLSRHTQQPLNSSKGPSRPSLHLSPPSSLSLEAPPSLAWVVTSSGRGRPSRIATAESGGEQGPGFLLGRRSGQQRPFQGDLLYTTDSLSRFW